MLTHRETQYLPYRTSEVFNLVANVEEYAEFLPWCIAARVLENNVQEGYLIAELLIGYKQIREKYTSKVLLTPPASPHGECNIEVELIKGPFKHLDNKWSFAPKGDGTEVNFSLDFEFKTPLLNKLIGAFFHKASQKMVEAFKKRADDIYGSSK